MAIVNDAPVAEKSKVGMLKFPLDPIHGGLRMAVLGSFMGAGILSFTAGVLLIPNGIFMAMILSGVSAAGASLGIERYLKNRWPSGREFVADSERIALTKNGKIESVIDPSQHVNAITWRFEVKKDGPRAKKGWQLLGLGLEQDDTFIVIYTAASREDYDKMPLSNKFTVLEKAKSDKKTTLSSPSNIRRAGEQKRIYEGEVVRQLVGGDMLFEQFLETIEFLQNNYPTWMISD